MIARVHVKDLIHFMDLDFKLAKTVVVDSKPDLCALDINNLVPVVPYCRPNSADDQLPRLSTYLKCLLDYEDVKESNRVHFGLGRHARHVDVESVMSHIFN